MTQLPGDEAIRCSECHRAGRRVYGAINEQWGFWSDGCGELLPYCPKCAKREFAPDAPAIGLAPLHARRAAESSR